MRKTPILFMLLGVIRISFATGLSAAAAPSFYSPTFLDMILAAIAVAADLSLIRLSC
jgi:hypothetical protein